ncbi:hypothetical protein WJX72_010222 [[Myrmecia] bisecta]|uniref:Non-haem dioxygenase N-terminal domain-containing protein n=1 Tax=[Myrmecia] bisecta TaxID=41462 RepID=A0AAW1R9Z1_9CHLO
MAQVVTLDYQQLTDPGADLLDEIEKAYGPSGLGILTVANVPGLPALRQRLLPLAQRFAELPEEAKRRCEDPDSLYNFGWSHGVESLQDGRPDRNKGSYYANPLHDRPTEDAQLMRSYPMYCRPNVWPNENLPELEPAFRELGRLIIDIGLLLTRHCDRYAQSKNPRIPPGRLEAAIGSSPCPKGRLLHYFPATSADDASASWCGWHTDHGSLTGLMAAMYMKDGKVVPGPDERAGLHIRDREGQVVRVRIPADHIAYQMGEAMQVPSGGLLRATPHYVQAPTSAAALGVSRNTFAVFMQPRWDEPMDLPPCDHSTVSAADMGVARQPSAWLPGAFGPEFCDTRP